MTWENGYAVTKELASGVMTCCFGPRGVVFGGFDGGVLVFTKIQAVRSVLVGFHVRCGVKSFLRRMQTKCSIFEPKVFKKILDLAGDHTNSIPFSIHPVGDCNRDIVLSGVSTEKDKRQAKRQREE